MRRLCFLCVFALAMLVKSNAVAQDFSNKGKDFWVAYGYHEVMNAGNLQEMILYFATDVATTVTVSIPINGYTATYNIPANTVFATPPSTLGGIPKAGVQDARLLSEGLSNLGIHITATNPIIAYAHVYNASVSGATILFPTNTLGKQYYSVNYTNKSNTPNANCWFYVVACDTGTTTVQITPSANSLAHPANIPFTVNLTQGQVYNVMGQLTGQATGTDGVVYYTGVDLTGSTIQSVSNGNTACKKIAVFSGSGRIGIVCNGSGVPSSDNYMVQAFPKSAWGKHFLTVPTASYSSANGNGFPLINNIYRICVQNPATIVTVNGASVAVPLVNNFYYEISATTQLLEIDADQPIMVAQYLPSQSACGTAGGDGDPETIYLSPVEQSINKVRWYACHAFQINQFKNYINVIIPNRGTAISSFKLDGVPVNPALFTVHPANLNYSYAVINVSATATNAPATSPGIAHIVQSDSGFNAIAYGYGGAESYGYNAGTNVIDLYQFVSIQNQFATVNYPSTCINSPFFFSMTFPYQPTQIIWNFGGVFANDTINNPVYDSTWIINGKQLYRYKIASSYSIATAGTYPIQVFAQNPTPDGCSGQQEIDFELQVSASPVADFTFTNNGCITDSVSFSDSSNLNGASAIKWHWDFADGGIDSIPNTKHLYSAAGSYTVKYSLITDVGCLSDTVSKVVTLDKPPTAKFGYSLPNCVGSNITFTDSSVAYNGATIAKWYWNFGDGSPQVVAVSNTPQTHIYATAGVFNVTLQVETAIGCQSIVDTLPVTIHVNPVANFSFGNVCLPVGTAQFTNLSTISDGTQSQFSYQWHFGDGGISTQQNPSHNYAGFGPYNVSLAVTSNNGCKDSSVKILNTVYAEPQAAFTSANEVCFGNAVNFTDQSTAAGSTVTQWTWNFGDGTTSTLQNPSHNYSLPGNYTVTLSVASAIGCQTVNKIATKIVIVDPLPDAFFNVSVPLCETRNILFTDSSVANVGSLVKWTWNYGDGTNAILASGVPFNHVYSSAGIYTVTLQVQTDKSCVSNVLTKQVSVYPVPIAGFISPGVCLLDPSAPFIDTSKVASGNIVAWNWNFGDANATPADPNTSTLQNPNHKYSATGSYTATLIVTTNQGCMDTVSNSFTVNGSVPLAGFNVQNANTLCSNQSVSIADTSSVNFGGLVKIEIYWDFTNNPTINTIDNNPVPGKIYSHTYPEFGNPPSQTYTIQYVAYSGINCVNTTTKTITVLATPTLQFDPLNPLCANNSPIQITQAQLQNGLPGTGTFSGPGVSSNGMFDPNAAGAGLHTIRYTYTGTNGCSNYLDQTIQVFPVPVVSAGPDRVVLEGGQTTLLGSGSGNNISFLWTPNISLSSNVIAQPIATPTNDITYTLTVTSSDGCSDTSSVYVKVLKAPVIPNIFSPNGDGIHDKWEITYLESYPGCTVDVFNRYGQLVFHSVGYTNPWDGTVKGQPVPIGTYYYIVDPKNGRKKIAGYVDVIR